MKDYRLTVTVTIREHDDPAARQRAKKLFTAFSEIASDASAKLQEVYPDKPPRGVRGLS